MMWRRALIWIPLLCAMAVTTACQAPPDLWFYGYVDLRRKENADEVNYTTEAFIDEVMPALCEQGYTAVILSSYQLSSQEQMSKPDSISRKNLERLRVAAKARGLQLIPEVMDIGSSSKVLQNGPNLAESAPAVDCAYVVDANRGFARLKDVTDRLKGRAPTIRRDAGAEITPTYEGGWSFCTGAIRQLDVSWKDLPVLQRHQYRLSLELALRESGAATQRVYLRLTNQHGQRLRKADVTLEPGPARTVHLSFNSLSSTRLGLELGFTESPPAAVTVDVSRARVVPVGGVNLVRRDRAGLAALVQRGMPARFAIDDVPVKVTALDGTLYMEGRDYARWSQKDMGLDGVYLHHDPAPGVDCPPIKILPGGSIRAGEVLKVSYYHAILPQLDSRNVCLSLTHPAAFYLLEQQVRRIQALLGPSRWLISHDELRAAGHEPSAEGKSPAELLRTNLIRCGEILDRVSPDSERLLVSDLYDPHHNAVAPGQLGSYHPLVNGSLEDSWEQLPRAWRASPRRMLIWNWSLGDSEDYDAAARSFKHFDALGFKQVVGSYYDRWSPERIGRHLRLARQNGAVEAVTYYTAKRQHQQLEAFADVVGQVWSSRR